MPRSITLRPSIVLKFTTRMVGGVSYQRVPIEETLDAKKTETKRWETKRVIEDLDEHKRAVTERSALYRKMKEVCSDTILGLICPKEDEQLLNEKLREAQEMTDKFNETARTCRLSCIGVKFNVEATNEEAAQAIAGQISDVLVQLEQQLQAGDYDGIRDTIKDAKGLEETMPKDQGGRILAAAMEAARKAATAIKKYQKKGLDLDLAVRVAGQEVNTAAVAGARKFFLDLDGEDAAAQKIQARTTSLDTAA